MGGERDGLSGPFATAARGREAPGEAPGEALENAMSARDKRGA